jgi:DNA-binding NtrC family response regulator
LSATAPWSAGGRNNNELPSKKDDVVKEKLESLVGEMIERRIYLGEALNEFEKRFIQNALSRTGGNQTKAAKVLGMHRNTLNRKIVQYKLNGSR